MMNLSTMYNLIYGNLKRLGPCQTTIRRTSARLIIYSPHPPFQITQQGRALRFSPKLEIQWSNKTGHRI
jgi:hypothetical protein